jgi:hypothetical protein
MSFRTRIHYIAQGLPSGHKRETKERMRSLCQERPWALSKRCVPFCVVRYQARFSEKEHKLQLNGSVTHITMETTLAIKTTKVNAKAVSWILEKGGELLADHDALNDQARLLVRCHQGHEWLAWSTNLAYKHSWCPVCYGNKSSTIEDMQEIAARRGGRCASAVYEGGTVHLNWVCAFGHLWRATPFNVKNHGSWCPHCRINVGEELVRATLEEAFPNKKFDRTRSVPWMHGLELDGYNEELSLAFEYQGKQHAERVAFFQSEEQFASQLARDLLTYERCADAKVVLLIVPHTVKHSDVREYVRLELIDIGCDLAPMITTTGEFYDKVRATGVSKPLQFARAVRIIEAKGGKCLSTQYVGYRVPLKIRCGAGHVFEATLESIEHQPKERGPRFCRECGGTRRKTDEELRVSAEECGYTFLSVESRYDDSGKSRRYMQVVCPNGHEKEVTQDNFSPIDGVPQTGCAKCHHARVGDSKRKDIREWCKEFQVWPMETYKNNTTYHNWKCAKDHSFGSTYAALRLKKGNKCIECKLDEIAADNRLNRLTRWDDYCGPTTPLEWQCEVCDTVITMSMTSISRKKTFCPICL